MRKVPILDRCLLAHHPGNLTSHDVGGEMRVRSGNTSVASPVVTAKRWQWQVVFFFVFFLRLRPENSLARKQDRDSKSFRPFCVRTRYGEAEHYATDDAEDRPSPANEESRTQFIPALENRCPSSFIQCSTWNATAAALTSVSQLSGQKTLLWSGVHTGSRRWASRGLRSGRIGGFRHLLVLPWPSHLAYRSGWSSHRRSRRSWPCSHRYLQFWCTSSPPEQTRSRRSPGRWQRSSGPCMLGCSLLVEGTNQPVRCHCRIPGKPETHSHLEQEIQFVNESAVFVFSQNLKVDHRQHQDWNFSDLNETLRQILQPKLTLKLVTHGRNWPGVTGESLPQALEKKAKHWRIW